MAAVSYNGLQLLLSSVIAVMCRSAVKDTSCTRALIIRYSFLVSFDPYIMEERDPLKSRAIESSLWELQALQNHILPSVATAAKFINMPLPSVEWDMSSIIENSADDVSTAVL
jgi:hypothetical protein